MAVTSNSYTGNGSQTLYSFTFPYISTSDIKVTLDGTATTQYSYANATQIQFASAPGNNVAVKIFRETESDETIATFYPGSAIRAADLNNNSLQNLYVSQEVINEADAATTAAATATTTATNATNTANTATTTANNATTTANSAVTTANAATATANTASTNATNAVNTANSAASSAASATSTANAASTTATNTASQFAGLQASAWESGAETVDSTETFHTSDDTKIATSKAIENRIDAKIDTALTSDVSADTAVVVTDNSPGSGQIKIGLDNKLVELSTMTSAAASAIADLSHTEVQILDGATLSTGELNKLDGVSSSTAELNILTGVTSTAGELNILDGVTASTNELNILDGVTATAAEINKVDGLTSSTTDLNQLQGKTVTTSFNSSNTNDIPTSTAINSHVVNLLNSLGGFVAIADDQSFPNANPDPSNNAGTVVSIANAGGLVIDSGGSTTTGRTLGSSTVTITGFPTSLRSQTLAADLGLQVQTTSTLNTYTYHKLIAKEADINQLSNDVNDFAARYRVGSSNPTTDLDSGDLFFNTTSGKMLVYDGTTSAWEEVQAVGSFNSNTLSTSGNTGGGASSFNGTAYRFGLSAAPPFAQQILCSINGVIQKPNSGTSQPSEGFALDSSEIIFSDPPPSGADFFIISIGSSVGIGTPSDNTVSTAKLQSLAVTGDKVATNLDLADNKKIRFGTGNDLEIYHSGTESWINNTTGDLILRNSASPGDVYIQAGGAELGVKVLKDAAVELYYDNSKKFETTASGIAMAGVENAGAQIKIGAGNDLQLEHDGTNTYIANTTGYLQVQSDDLRLTSKAGGEPYLKGAVNGSVELYYDNSKKFETRSDGTQCLGDHFFVGTNNYLQWDKSEDFLRFMDGVDATFGNGDDLRIYHDGSHSYIHNNTGRLRFETDNLGFGFFKGPGSEYIAMLEADGACSFYYDNSKKLETVSTGVYVYGDVGVGIGGTGNLFAGDSRKLQCGNGNDLQMYHDGTNTYFENLTGNVYFRNDGSTTYFQMGSANDTGISISKNDTVQLYFDDNSQLRTTSNGVVIGDSDHADSNLRVDHEDNTGKGRVEVNAFGLANIQLLSNFSGSAEHGVPNGAFGLTTPQSRDIHFCTAGTSRMTIASDGTWRYNTSSDSPDAGTTTGMAYSSSKFRVSRSADPCAAFNRANSNGDIIQLNYNGTQRGSISTDGTVIAFNTSSDYRLKENEVAISDGITRLKTLKPYRFNFISNPSKTVDGFFAHEVTAVPEAITGEKDGDDMQGMDYSKLTPLLTAALQEAITKIETLETKVAALEAK